MTDQSIIRIAIADDHGPARAGLKMYSEGDGDIVVAYEASNGQQMLDMLIGANPIPDVCLIDIHMPVMDGVGLLRAIKSRWPSIRCLVITGDDYHPLMLRMIRQGVNGYLLKSLDPDELTHAIRTVFKLGYYYSGMAGLETFQMIQNKKIQLREVDEQELEFLRLICSDLSYDQIAAAMGMSVSSNNNLRKKLFHKFGVASRVSLAFAAVNEGLVPDQIPTN